MAAVEQIPLSRDDLDSALRDADVPILLMVLVHLTGDRRWLEAPYLPERDISFFADESGGLSVSLQQELRSAAADAVLAFREHDQEPPPEHAGMIWTHPGMDTWYRNKDGRVVSVMPWRLVDYWEMTRAPNLDEYLKMETD